MDTFTYFFLVCVLGLASTIDATEISSIEYLDRQSREAKVEMAKTYFERIEPVPVVSDSYDVQWQKLWSEPLNTNRALTMNIFDKMFVLDGNEIMSVIVKVEVENSNLRNVAVIHQEHLVKFVRSIVWKATLYLLVCYEIGSCTLYTGKSDMQLQYRQTIRHKGLPMDAIFFTQANQLYLVVADNTGQFTVPSMIYRWAGTYMDVIKEVMTTGAVSVTVFKYKHSMIIVFAQNVKGNSRIGSKVYKFNQNSMEMIQFLTTDSPVSVYSYDNNGYNFLLVINEMKPCNVFWWDGKELLDWFEFPDIKSQNLVNIVHFYGDTFFVVSQANHLYLYKILNLSYVKLDHIIELKDTKEILNMGVWIEDTSIILILITMGSNNLYKIELLEMRIKKHTHEKLIKEVDVTMKRLSELADQLKNRMAIIENAKNLWPSLLPSSENIVVTTPISIPNLIIDSGNISNIDVSVTQDIFTPTEFQNNFENLSREADEILATSRKTVQMNKTTTLLTGNVVIEGDAFFDTFYVDSLNISFLNDKKLEFDNIISSTKDQHFSSSLRAENVTVHELEIDSLCGIPFKHWQLKNNTLGTSLDIMASNVELREDTIFVHSDLFLQDFKVDILNRVDLQPFLSDLFIIGQNQVIKGNIHFRKSLRIANLTVQSLNGISSDKLMTKTTNQDLGNVFVRSLKIENLTADTINGVPVAEAARISQENVIKGCVTIANLYITENVVFDSDIKLPKISSVQIYDNVTIVGDLFVKYLDFKSENSLILNGVKTDINNLFKSFWTKSTDQIIENSVTFENGITIDELDTKYLNGLSESDYLYTTMKEIPTKFGKLHFENFQTGGSIIVEGRESSSFVITNDSLIINEKLRIENLTTQNLFTETYNQIPINVIAKEEIASFAFPENFSFETIQINDRLTVDDLNVEFINELNVSEFFERAMYVNNSYQIKNLRIPKFEIDYFLSNRMNEIEMNLLIMLKNADSDIVQNLTIDGDLEIDGNMQVDYINNQSASYYLKRLAEVDVVVKSEDIFDNIIVHDDLTVNLLRGMRIESFVQSTLSKSREQTLPGQFSFYSIRANNLRTNVLNRYNLSNLLFIDDPLIFEGNVTFTNLLMNGDVVAGQLNGYNVTELYENFLTVPSMRISNLILHGNIFWETPLTGSSSLSYLFNNAVTKNTNQIISEATTFENNVFVSSINTSETINGIDIKRIVSDAVIIKENSEKNAIMIKGQKTFKRGLFVDNLVVENNIGIPKINGWNILHLNASVVRKFNDETVLGPTIFIKDITIGTLFVNGNVHGMTLDGLVTTSNTLPNTVYFKELHVRGNVSSIALDGVEFSDFMKDRVTIHGNHEIYGDLQFNGQVTVTDRASVLLINDIKPTELVLSQDKYDQIISGSKAFIKSLVVEDNVHVPLINDMDMINEYNTGILNDEHVEIFGDIIFETDVEISTNTTVSGLINEVDLTCITDELKEQEKNVFLALRQNETIIETMILRSLNASFFLPDIFFYFETEEKLIIRVPNIHKVYPVNIASMTKLNMYGSELGRYCGLPDDCPCTTQYVAEIVEKGCEVWKMNSSRIVYNFHEPNGVFGINVVTNTVSSSVQCSRQNPETEFTSVSWMTPVESVSREVSGSVSNGVLKINGFLSDVKVFTYNKNVYVVLALYYDALHSSHTMHSLIYKLDLVTKKITLMQKIRTSGAWTIEVFKVPTQGPHLLIGCVQYPAKSQLYKLNPLTSKFEFLTTFTTGGNRYTKSLIQENDCFILLDDSGTNSVHIFRYDFKFYNFYHYQSLYHESRINGIEVFYAGESEYSDAYVIVTTENGQFFLYEYMFLGKFQLKIHQWLDGVQTMVPFFFMNRHYIFIGTNANSTIFRIVHQGPHQT